MTRHYLPPLRARLVEFARTLWRVLVATPPLELRPGDCVVVCDAIEAYRSLFSPRHVRALRELVHLAEREKIPVVYTRWNRVDNSRGDAVDAKGHWSEYVHEISQTCLMPEVPRTNDDVVVPVIYPNALSHTAVLERCAQPPCGRRVVIAGGWAEACVISTARAALEHNLRPVVVSDATVGHAGARTLALVQIQTLCGEVLRIL